MKPRELCEKAWQEIASNFNDFKVTKKGQIIKKNAKNKDITFEIYFHPNSRNYSFSTQFSVHFFIHSKQMKKDNLNNGLIYCGEFENILNRGRSFRWFELAGANYQYTVNEIVELVSKYIVPICDDFENTEKNIDKILENGTSNIDLFYYVYYFGGKQKSERFLSNFIEKSNFKNKYRSFYKSLESLPKECIDINHSEFMGASMLKFAYLNGIKIDS